MKLVIDIPENTYKRIQTLASNGYFEHDICGNSMRRIADGKPLDSVLDDIRAEIEMEKLGDSSNFFVKAYNDAVDRVLAVIDKYKTESEG